MTISVYIVLIAAIWITYIAAACSDLRTGGYLSGLGAMILLPCAIAATLAILLVRAWGWL